ncbi:hypothetical protein [Demequina mangrovi]|uniref:hypothetical protein n=1 Tax=Demequina mangrovi TaxID=1043493 RepID=UPI00115FF4F6|nr:hypothetical protein [Demequina mangrovi]
MSRETQEIATRMAARRVLAGYVALWVLEGAIRKWGPGALDQPFYVARDAALVGAMAAFYIQGLPRRRHLWWPVLWAATFFLAIHGTVAMLMGTVDTQVLVLGLRGYVSGLLLLVFTMTYADATALDAVTDTIAVLALILLPIVILQVLSEPSAWINRQTAGEDASFVNAGTAVRPSATFTAPAGFAPFIGLGLAMSVARVTFGTHRRLLHGCALGALTLMSAVSGSRAIAIVGVMLVVVLLYIAARRFTIRSLVSVLGMLGAITLGLVIANRVFADVLEAFSTRVDTASRSEDTGARIFSGIVGFITEPVQLLGSGAGAHSSVGVQRLGTAWAENDKLKYMAELGVVGYGLAILSLVGALWALVHIVIRAGSAPPTRLMALAVLAAALSLGGVTQQPSIQGGFAVTIAIIALTSGTLSPPDHGGTPAAKASKRPVTTRHAFARAHEAIT